MAKSMAEWMDYASTYKGYLDDAIADRDSKNVIYYRGKYLYALKQIHKLNPNELIPPYISGRSSPVGVGKEIEDQLKKHSQRIDNEIKNNKKDKNRSPSISREFGLKIRRLATKFSQVSFSNGTVKPRHVVGAGLSIVGTAAKAPLMVTTKVASKVGPLAVSVFMLPFEVIASAVVAVEPLEGQIYSKSEYDNTFVHKMSKSMSEGVGKICDKAYNKVSRL